MDRSKGVACDVAGAKPTLRVVIEQCATKAQSIRGRAQHIEACIAGTQPDDGGSERPETHLEAIAERILSMLTDAGNALDRVSQLVSMVPETPNGPTAY